MEKEEGEEKKEEWEEEERWKMVVSYHDTQIKMAKLLWYSHKHLYT